MRQALQLKHGGLNRPDAFALGIDGQNGVQTVKADTGPGLFGQVPGIVTDSVQSGPAHAATPSTLRISATGQAKRP